MKVDEPDQIVIERARTKFTPTGSEEFVRDPAPIRDPAPVRDPAQAVAPARSQQLTWKGVFVIVIVIIAVVGA